MWIDFGDVGEPQEGRGLSGMWVPEDPESGWTSAGIPVNGQNPRGGLNLAYFISSCLAPFPSPRLCGLLT